MLKILVPHDFENEQSIEDVFWDFLPTNANVDNFADGVSDQLQAILWGLA